ncbi:MAG: TonB-dependent receptor [Prevotella sp.]|jgi:outer membrane cobalamin receptor|nr:TonB-dependent receptor [Prevotella sp.]
MRKKLSFLLVGILFCTVTAFSQVTVKGIVLDKDTKEPLIGVTIYSETEKKGTATDIDGGFSLNLSSSKGNLKFTYVGYKALTLEASANMGTIEMESNAFGLNDVIITSTIGVDRKTPVAMSSIDAEVLLLKTGSKEFPEMLKSTPGVYATKTGGGFGDSRVNIRGFSSENVAVMINGVPVNDMEWGGVYWSNWAGMMDVARFMQVQRGLGASKVASPSVGGSINVVTRSTDAKKGGSVYYGTGDSGYNKLSFNLSTGLLDNGWAVTLLGSKAWADGYIQGTQYETYTYFLNVSKKLGADQTLSFTAFGAPQWHNQRKDQLLISEWAKLPESGRYRYNAGYGYDASGQLKTFNHNIYHKPMISLNHVWDIDLKSSLSTVLYLSIGSGGGYTGMGNTDANRLLYNGSSTNGKVNNMANSNFPYRKDDGNVFGYGTYDFAKLMADNAASANGSILAIENSINNHVWAGILSTYSNKLSDEIEIQGGLDLRYYKGIHTAEIVDLLGGKFITDSQRAKDGKFMNNSEWVNEKLTVGDIVYRDYDSFIMQEGVFGQAEYSKNKLSAFVSGALNMTNYSRLERFTADNEKSGTKNKVGFSIKGGANYNLTENHNVFANIGYFSRTPYFSAGVFINSRASNAMNPDPRNEKVFSVEAGYGYVSRYLNAKVNVYRTEWNDKTMVKAKTPGRPEDGTLNMTGVNALHQGIEIELVSRPVEGLELKAMGSFGDWKWNSNASGYYIDQYGVTVEEKGEPVMGEVKLKGIHVGNSAQTTIAFGADYEFLKGLRIGLDYNYYGKNYADYSISVGANYIQPWQMPEANLWDANLHYKFKIGGLDASFTANVDNLFDAVYITDAKDGGNGKAETAMVYYGFGRTWRAGLKILF